MAKRKTQELRRKSYEIKNTKKLNKRQNGCYFKTTAKTPLPTPSLCSQVRFGQKKDLIESWLVAASILLILILCCNASN
jgi:hypothetical protein